MVSKWTDSPSCICFSERLDGQIMNLFWIVRWWCWALVPVGLSLLQGSRHVCHRLLTRNALDCTATLSASLHCLIGCRLRKSSSDAYKRARHNRPWQISPSARPNWRRYQKPITHNTPGYDDQYKGSMHCTQGYPSQHNDWTNSSPPPLNLECMNRWE